MLDAAQSGRLDAVPELLRPDIADEVRGPVGVAVGMAIEAGHAAAGLCRATILGQVELLLRERRHQEPQPVELLGVQEAVEQLVVILDRDQLARATRRRDRAASSGKWPAETRGGSARADRTRKVEPIEIAAFLLHHFLDVEFGKDHAPFGMMRMGERHKTRRETRPSREFRLATGRPAGPSLCRPAAWRGRLPAAAWCGPSSPSPTGGPTGRNARQAGRAAASSRPACRPPSWPSPG